MATQQSRWLGAAALAVLVATLLLALGDASAQQPPMSASIGDDPSGGSCNHEVWSDSHCDLQISAVNPNRGAQNITIVTTNYFGRLENAELIPDSTSLAISTCSAPVHQRPGLAITAQLIR